MTDFLDLHPGGSKIILANAGKDATRLFLPIHPPNTLQTNLDPNQLVGQLDDAAVEAIKALGPGEEEKRIKRARAELGHGESARAALVVCPGCAAKLILSGYCSRHLRQY